MPTRPFILAIVLAAVVAFAAIASGQEQDPTVEPLEGLQSNNDLTEVTGRVLYESAAGDFEVFLPPGCGRYRERIPTDEIGDEGYEFVELTVYVYCDRKDTRNEGCSVMAYVDRDLDSGVPADADFVQARVVAILQKYNVHVVDQQPFQRVLEDGPRMEGIDVLATDAEERGQVWVRGLLVEGDVYLLVAWRAEGALAEDPEIVDFFESFRAHL